MYNLDIENYFYVYNLMFYMEIQIYIFFIFVTIAFLLSGILFKRNSNDTEVKKYGKGLVLSGVAFGVWTVAVISNPISITLNNYVSIGLIVFMVAQLINLNIVSSVLSSVNKKVFMTGSFILIIATFVIRFFLPSSPEIIENGMIFFNPNDMVAFLEIVLIAGAMLSSAIVVSNKISESNKISAKTLLISMIISVIGIVVLLTSTKIMLLTLVGWAIAVGVAMLLYSSIKLNKTY